ncbi:hypothetical protein [Streptomyces sp. NPDC005859]|uniref:hypothetical protein n=1 Tax=Streptomyces sp. NPDC005859 TaxID=3157170 RepID=UPI0033D51F97
MEKARILALQGEEHVKGRRRENTTGTSRPRSPGSYDGIHTVDIGGEPAKLDADSYRPLRLPAQG